MTRARVRTTLGAPGEILNDKWDKRWGALVDIFRYGKTEIVFIEGTVWEVRTTAARIRTSSGLGVGSTRAQVRAKLDGEHCFDNRCEIWSGNLGNSRALKFVFTDDVVSKVRLTYEPD